MSLSCFFILFNVYKSAFEMRKGVILVLKQLNTNEKIEFINYYNEKLKNIFMS